jgi:hypothetical protein
LDHEHRTDAGWPGGGEADMDSSAASLRSGYGAVFCDEIGREAAVFIQRVGRVNRVRGGIGQLETVRESVASDQPVVIYLNACAGTGMTEVYAQALFELLHARPLREIQHAPRRHLLGRGSRIATTNWPSSLAATFAGETLVALDAPSATRAADLPLTPADLTPPHRSADQWCHLDAFVPVEGWNYRSGTHGPKPSPERQASDLIRLVVNLDQFSQPRAGLLRIIDGCLAALRLALVFVFAAYANCPASRSFTLILIATFRHYGHRSEPDDYSLPAHRWISVIGGEPVLSC